MGSSTPTPWARGNPSLGAVVKSQNRDSAQQRRETVNITKPNVFSSDGGDLIIPGRRDMPGNAGKVLTVNATTDAYELAALPTGGGGGPIGMAQVRSQNGTVLCAAGDGLMNYPAVRYDYTVDPNSYDSRGATTVPIASWLSISGNEITLAAGYYIAVMHLRLSWASQADAPVALTAFMGGGYDDAHQDYASHPVTAISSSGWGVSLYVNHGPTWVDGSTPFYAQSEPVPAFPANNTTSDSRVNWVFTKLT